MTAISPELGIVIFAVIVAFSGLAWHAGKQSGIAEQNSRHQIAGKTAAELVSEAGRAAEVIRGQAVAAAEECKQRAVVESAERMQQADVYGGEILKRAELYSAETHERAVSESAAVRLSAEQEAEIIRRTARFEAEALLVATREQLENECAELKADLRARDLHMKQRTAAADRLVSSYEGLLDSLRNRSPERPLGGIALSEIAQRVEYNWENGTVLAELAFELTRRSGLRAGEMLNQVGNRLLTLGVPFSLPSSIPQDAADSAARLALLVSEVKSLRKQRRRAEAEVGWTARIAEMQAKLQAATKSAARWEERYREAKAGNAGRDDDAEEELERALHEMGELRRRGTELQREAESLRRRVAELEREVALKKPGGMSLGPLSAYFVLSGAPKGFVDYARRFWRKELHPDAGGGAAATAKYQEMDDAFEKVSPSR